MADPTIRAFLDRIETTEILPIVPPVPGHDLADDKTLILDRFSNPEVADTERRPCLDGSNRQPKFIIPSIRDNLARGVMPKDLILASALWCRYCAGVDETGAEIAPNDPKWDQLRAAATSAKEKPEEWLKQAELITATGPILSARLMFDCTPKGDLFGIAVNGRRVRFAEHVFYRFEAGLIVEVWSLIDQAAIAARISGNPVAE